METNSAFMSNIFIFLLKQMKAKNNDSKLNKTDDRSADNNCV